MEEFEPKDEEGEVLRKASQEYGEKLRQYVENYAPWLLKRFHLSASGYAGGKSTRDPNWQEKMAIQAINPDSLADADDGEVNSLHHRLHQLYVIVHQPAEKAEPDVSDVHIPTWIETKPKRKLKGLTLEDVVNAHHFVVAEMEKRGMKHSGKSEGLDAEKIAKADKLTDITLVRDYVSRVGSSVQGEGRDWDWLIREADKNREPSFEVALARAFDPDKQHDHHFIWDPKGPHADYRPVGDLVVRLNPRGMEEVPRVQKAKSVQPGKPVQALKSAGGGAAMDLDGLVKLVGDAYPVRVECKWDGERVMVSKDGSTLHLTSDDLKSDYADKDVLRAACGGLPDRITLDTELLLFKGGQQLLPRLDMPGLMRGSDSWEGVTPKFATFDVLGAQEGGEWQDYHALPLEEREKKLHALKLPKAFQVVTGRRAGNGAELRKAWDWASKVKGSEGAMVKALDGDYPLSGSTSAWWKLKRNVEVHVKIADKRRAGDAWIYGCETRDGVPVGNTYATKLDANAGEVLAVMPAEIKFREGKLSWDNPRVSSLHHGPADTAEHFRNLAGRRVAKDEEGGETRSEAADQNWSQNWWKMLKPSGRFVFHLHVRGIPEEAKDWPLDKLVAAGHSVHGDLRLEGPDALWGVTPFKGQEFLEGKGDVQCALKQAQPKNWLNVGKSKPLISEPGGVGATSQKYAKFFAMDSGTYDLGSAREHMVEIFLHGSKLKGRRVIQYAELGGTRKWLIDNPQDQKPYSESHNLDDVEAELKAKGQDHLWWGQPGKSKLLVIKSESQYAEIVKADKVQQIVWGVVLEPKTLDAQGDWELSQDIEKAAHDWLENSRQHGVQHGGKAQMDIVPVESYIVPADVNIGGQAVPKGAWVIAAHVQNADTWARVEKGELNGFSIQGFGRRSKKALE